MAVRPGQVDDGLIRQRLRWNRLVGRQRMVAANGDEIGP
jgi:hypothetical protein